VAVRFADARILVFAKAPLPGQVKTRLAPPLTQQQAAALHRELVSGTLERLARAHIAPVELWCAPHPGFSFFTELEARFGVRLYPQTGRDLGERMLRAARDGLSRCRRLVLVGTDCPVLTGAEAAEALNALARRDAALGPAEDGGYVLLGLKRAAPELFADMPWGTAEVAGLTRARMTGLGWRWAELPTLWDLDRPADLARYRSAGLASQVRWRMSSRTALLPK
jgi:rSAM/selenodomain-associated transferase 1